MYYGTVIFQLLKALYRGKSKFKKKPVFQNEGKDLLRVGPKWNLKHRYSINVAFPSSVMSVTLEQESCQKINHSTPNGEGTGYELLEATQQTNLWKDLTSTRARAADPTPPPGCGFLRGAAGLKCLNS